MRLRSTAAFAPEGIPKKDNDDSVGMFPLSLWSGSSFAPSTSGLSEDIGTEDAAPPAASLDCCWRLAKMLDTFFTKRFARFSGFG